MNFADLDVIILCGGKGTRLAPVLSDRPKILAPLTKTETALDVLLVALKQRGFKRVILALGYMHELVLQHMAEHNDPQLTVVLSIEPEPLGTGGALKLAMSHVSSDPFFVLNGDTFCDLDYAGLFKQHRAMEAVATVAVSRALDRTDTGNIVLADDNRIVSFAEKSADASRVGINAGIYCFSKNIAPHLPHAEVFSLEQDVFAPMAAAHAGIYGFLTNSPAIDIGTPERYEKAKKLGRFKN